MSRNLFGTHALLSINQRHQPPALIGVEPSERVVDEFDRISLLLCHYDGPAVFAAEVVGTQSNILPKLVPKPASHNGRSRCLGVGPSNAELSSRGLSSAESGVAPATLSGVAEGGGGGCSSELGFCGMSGKSGGKVGGVTGGGAGRGL
jgi:hypothetical protein